MPWRRQYAVSAVYDSSAPAARSSSWTRTRLLLHAAKSSRICCRYGSAFSARGMAGISLVFERSTLRTLWRESFNTRAISRVGAPFALSSRIAVLCAWLNMLVCSLPSESLRDAVQLAPRAFHLPLRLFPLLRIHIAQCFAQPPAGAAQDGGGHLQIARQFRTSRLRLRRSLALRLEKQPRFGQQAFADGARSLAPGCVQLRRLSRTAALLHERRRHALALLQADSRHWRQIPHSRLRCDLSFTHLLLDDLGEKFDQRQTPRHPTDAAVEALPQFLQRVTEALLHLRQKPALFQRRFLLAETQRALQ